MLLWIILGIIILLIVSATGLVLFSVGILTEKIDALTKKFDKHFE